MNVDQGKFYGHRCRRAGIVGMAAALWASMSGCADVQALERPYPVAAPMPPEVAQRFDYEAGEIRAELSPVRENSTYSVFEGRFDPVIAGSDDDTPCRLLPARSIRT